MSSCAIVIAQNPPADEELLPRVLVLSVTSTAVGDGAEFPATMRTAGDNKSPGFEFHWNLGQIRAPRRTLQTYAVIFHDLEKFRQQTTADTLTLDRIHIPGTAKGLPEAPRDRRSRRRDTPKRPGPRSTWRIQAISGLAPARDRSITTCSSSMLWTRSWIFRPTRRADELLKAMDGHGSSASRRVRTLPYAGA